MKDKKALELLDDLQNGKELTENEMKTVLRKAGGWDNPVMIHIMNEIEICDDLIYNQNLPAATYIEVKARKEALCEIRDLLCKDDN